MKALTKLLERINETLHRGSVAKETIVTCIQETAGFALAVEDIEVTNGVLEIHTTPARKNAINLVEQNLLRLLRERSIVVSRILYK
jgi:hypothetical protein